MTCSYRDSIKHQGPFDFDRAKSECLKRTNCTAVRKNYCAVSNSDLHYDFCDNEPIPLEQLQNATDSQTPCVWKKVDPDGTF